MQDDDMLDVPLVDKGGARDVEAGESFSDAGDAEDDRLEAPAVGESAGGALSEALTVAAASRACAVAAEAAALLAKKSAIIGAAITYFSFAQALSDGRAATIAYACSVAVAARAAAFLLPGRAAPRVVDAVFELLAENAGWAWALLLSDVVESYSPAWRARLIALGATLTLAAVSLAWRARRERRRVAARNRTAASPSNRRPPLGLSLESDRLLDELDLSLAGYLLGYAAYFAAWIFRSQVAATPRPRREYSVVTSRGDAAAATWTFHGDESRRRRGRDVNIP